MKVHNMSLQKRYFDDIVEGKKTYEIRLNDEKRQNVQEGDVIEFSNADSDSQMFISTIVEGREEFETFEGALDGIIDQALPGVESMEEAVSIYNEIPSYKEGEEKYGVVRFKLR